MQYNAFGKIDNSKKYKEPEKSYFIPFMLSRWPLPDLVASKEEEFETREKDLINCIGTPSFSFFLYVAASSIRVPRHMRSPINPRMMKMVNSKPFVGSLACVLSSDS